MINAANSGRDGRGGENLEADGTHGSSRKPGIVITAESRAENVIRRSITDDCRDRQGFS